MIENARKRIADVFNLRDKISGINRVRERQEKINAVASLYGKGSIDAYDFYTRVEQISLEYADIPRVRVDNPWSLYKLLREGAEWDMQTAIDTVTEEVDHFLVASRNNLDPTTCIEAEYAEQETGNTLLYYTFTLPKIYLHDIESVDPSRLEEVYRAPVNPSSDDQAKLD